MSDQILCRFTLNHAIPDEEQYIGSSPSMSSEDNNFFYIQGQTLYDLKRTFPIPGDYHFRCLSKNGEYWIDLVTEQDDLIVQDDNSIELKVLDISALNNPPKKELTYEQEITRIQRIERDRLTRPHCLVPDAGEVESDTNGSVSSQAKNVAKKGMEKASKTFSKLKGFFKG